MGQSPNSNNYTDNPKYHILVQGNADMKDGQVYPRIWTTEITKTANKGDLILTVRAPVGDVGKTSYDIVIGRGVAAIKGNEFIFQLLKRMKATGYWTKYSTGSTFESINSSEINNAVIHLPKKHEQIEVGNVLSYLDQTITLHEEKKHQLGRLKSALLQKMFADKSGYPAIRFKGFEEVWKHQMFRDIVKELQNNTLSRSELNYECGTVKNIHYGDILTKFGEFIDASKASLPYISDNTKADKFEKSFLKNGDIVIADTAEDDTVGKCVEIQGSEHLKISAGLHTIACRPKQQYGSKYLGYYFNSPVYHNQLHPLMQGIKVTSISKSAIQNTDVHIPQSVAEQSKIGDVLSKLDSLISLNQREVKKLSIIKQSLLQKMFI